jgi:hypothetical protein
MRTECLRQLMSPKEGTGSNRVTQLPLESYVVKVLELF